MPSPWFRRLALLCCLLFCAGGEAHAESTGLSPLAQRYWDWLIAEEPLYQGSLFEGLSFETPYQEAIGEFLQHPAVKARLQEAEEALGDINLNGEQRALAAYAAEPFVTNPFAVLARDYDAFLEQRQPQRRLYLPHEARQAARGELFLSDQSPVENGSDLARALSLRAFWIEQQESPMAAVRPSQQTELLRQLKMHLSEFQRMMVRSTTT